MIIRKVEFIKSAKYPKYFPPEIYPEVAFAGRSNVGKSSLINTLVRRKKMVKTSQTPGKTQMINFFTVNDEMYLVDLPGYGYAKVSRSIRQSWKPMVEKYLVARKQLRGLVLLMDIRREPGEEERGLISLMPHYAIQPVLVATKIDKLKSNERFKRKLKVTKALNCSEKDITFFSSKTGEGREELWHRISSLLSVESHNLKNNME